jgi:hypothetical protein
MRHIS